MGHIQPTILVQNRVKVDMSYKKNESEKVEKLKYLLVLLVSLKLRTCSQKDEPCHV